MLHHRLTLSQIARPASEVPLEWHLKGTEEGKVSFSTEAFSSLTVSFEKYARSFSGDTWPMPSQSGKLRKVSSAYPMTSVHWLIKRVCSEGYTFNGLLAAVGDEGASVARY